ncbi:enoyl-CoA hydratase/isomerase family protein [Gallaecimonas kandeliae]|uniref:enoyl-CoA hydratase/isomerase family protein n=1 Tax=Gallaecimonas kandeliae TaxID=3029055 RepID=UPI00264860F7|nr:enoyl-CoA hydratase/isomerase family protein [Gallaecimonas kandeliae]WKE66842.1 enoyl-CoA hydratase/isomerase family protein [Gallaecimonas kandeliae]
MSDIVQFEELDTANGKCIGVARLNSEKSLNALSEAMIDLLGPQLKAWEEDHRVVMVVLEGAGEKAFCAGGDVVALYNAMKDGDNGGQAVEQFFLKEYRLDYQIHCLKKPVLIWGHGIIMGGGLGLMSGASHRVVTETARIAMPEITIGLYPDVGGTYFLSRMPGKCGLFLGLTGANINAADALYVGLADHFIPSEDKGRLFDALCHVNWGETLSLNHEKLSQALKALEQPARVKLPRGQVKGHQEAIDHLCEGEDLAAIVDRICGLETEDSWLARARDALKHGSPLSASIVFEQLKRGGQLSLADAFRLEAGLSWRCGEFGEFQEGVRALLIEKDRNPNWRFKSVADVDGAVLARFFESPWDLHPLANI